MRTRGRAFRINGCAAVALSCIVLLAPGCGRPPDEAWLQFLGFSQGGTTITVFEDQLLEASTATVDAEFQNGSLNLGSKAGTGIFVSRARVEYRMTGFSPPAAEHPLNLYLPAPADGSPTTGTLSSFPLAPPSLKQWLISAGAAKSDVLELTASVRFFARTDEGADIETTGSIGISLLNGAKPTATVSTADLSIVSGLTGKFTVYRTGSLESDLTVSFTIGGTASATTDYFPFGTSVVIPSKANLAELTVALRATAVADRTITVNLGTGTSYTVGSPSTATMHITP